jgi:hypothetical protein
VTGGGDWTDAENDRIVDDYFDMLADELARRSFSKAAHNRALQSHLPGRSHTSIEFKHRNISAVLQFLNQPWILGYLPAKAFQVRLIDAVVRRLGKDRMPYRGSASGGQEAGALFFEPPPPPLNRPSLDPMRAEAIARRFDPAEADARNRELGRAGEALVLAHERHALAASGREDLADQVRWTSQEDGDGAGYDIASFTPEGRPRLVEVKTTNGWERSAFHISRNELAVANDNRESWRLVRVWNFAREPRAFELAPPLDAHVRLAPTSFLATFG